MQCKQKEFRCVIGCVFSFSKSRMSCGQHGLRARSHLGWLGGECQLLESRTDSELTSKGRHRNPSDADAMSRWCLRSGSDAGAARLPQSGWVRTPIQRESWIVEQSEYERIRYLNTISEYDIWWYLWIIVTTQIEGEQVGCKQIVSILQGVDLQPADAPRHGAASVSGTRQAKNWDGVSGVWLQRLCQRQLSFWIRMLSDFKPCPSCPLCSELRIKFHTESWEFENVPMTCKDFMHGGSVEHDRFIYMYVYI